MNISNDDRVDVEFSEAINSKWKQKKSDSENNVTFSGHIQRERKIVSQLFSFRPTAQELFLLPSKFIQPSLFAFSFHSTQSLAM